MTCQLLTYLPILLHIFLLKLNMKWQKCRNICVLHSVNITAKKTTLTCQLTTEKISLISVEALWFLTSTTCNREENWKHRIMNFTIKYIYKKNTKKFVCMPPVRVSAFASLCVCKSTYYTSRRHPRDLNIWLASCLFQVFVAIFFLKIFSYIFCWQIQHFQQLILQPFE